MRRIGLILLIFCACCAARVAAQTPADSVPSGWFWLSPLPQGNDLFGVWAIDAQHAVAVGGESTVLTTSDGGTTWLFQSGVGGTTKTLRSVYFLDNLHGYAVGDSGVILYTATGGASWVLRPTSITDVSFNNVVFSGSDLGWIVGDRGMILRTTTGGRSWNPRPVATNGRNLSAIQAVSSTELVACGQLGLLLHSLDGGVTWDTLPAPAGTFVDLRDMKLTPDKFGLLAGTNVSFFKTVDTTYTWLKLNNIGVTGHDFNRMSFSSFGQGFVVGDHGLVANTSNNGGTWNVQILDTAVDFHGVSMTGGVTGWIVGDHGRIYKLINGGAQIVSQSSSFLTNINDVHFIDSEHGWAVGDGGSVLFSPDSGRSWHTQVSGTTNRLLSVSFVDTNRGLAGGENGTIIRTTNGGTTWATAEVATTSHVRSVKLFSAGIGSAMGDNGLIARTLDGGSTWVVSPFSASMNFTSHTYVDAGTIWASGYVSGLFGLGKVAYSRDGGVSFTFVDDSLGLPPAPHLFAISFESRDLGYVVGERGYVFRTTDRGQTWRKRPTPAAANLNAIHTIGGSAAWAAGDDGVILRTDDGGDTWKQLNSGTNRNLRSIEFLDSKRGWVAGDLGSVLTTEDGGGEPVVIVVPRTRPTQTRLLGNYPNPFNPGTYLTFQLEVQTNVTIQIYNIMGMKVREFDLGLLDKGYYDGQYGGNPAPFWDGLDKNGRLAPSGTYFYRLITPDVTTTKKMLLIR